MNKPVNACAGYGIQSYEQLKGSRSWFERAKRVLAGGISSSARTTMSGDILAPLYITQGSGSHIRDVDGNEYIDYLLSYGSLILGHCNPALTEALKNQIEHGTMFGTCNTVEVELAEQICKMVPCAELVRFANSGSEAICGAVRAARGYTGKNKIVKFEGHYHGWVDVLAVSNRPTAEQAGPLEAPLSRPHSKGIPQGVVEDVVMCPWNQPQILKNLLDRYDGQIAAIIAEPIVANNACIMPAPGYLEFLRDECRRRKIVLIFDEIVTGFRAAPGGAQQLFGVECDIAVFSKALGGGMPISAFAGKRFVMEPIAANTVKHGGTYNASPICATAALCTLRLLAEPATGQRIQKTGNSLMEAIHRAAKDNHISCRVQGIGSMFQVVFTEAQSLLHYRDLFTADFARFASFRNTLLKQGVHINSSGLVCWFVSAAHTADDIELTTDAIKAAMRAIS